MNTTADLIEALRGVLGDPGLITDPGAMAGYVEEQRGLYRGNAPAVARPASTDEVARVVKLCADAGVGIVPLGGNTGLVGGGIADGQVVLSLERMNKILDVDPVNATMTVEAGAILADIQAAADAADAYFPLSLGAEGSCRIGGNLSTNAGGVHVVRYGAARDLVLGLEVVLADGRVWDGLTALRKNNTGYNLKALFLGAEGTLGVITRAVLRLFPKPRAKAVALAGCGSFDDALQLLHAAQRLAGDALMACEAMNGFSVELAEKHVAGAASPLEGRHECYVLLELGAADAKADLGALMEEVLTEAFEATAVEDAVIAQSGPQADGLWRLREAVPEAQKLEGGSIKHDVSVPVSKTPEFIRRASEAVQAMIPGVRVVAFGHLGDGNTHFNLTQPVDMDKQAFLERWHEVNARVHDVAAELGGSFSAEHGIGRLKTGEMARLKSAVELDLMRAVKNALDPLGIFNPGKVLPPRK
ncbi:MAG: FAD-binding oxidoreductase [Alphaproteobacteria bacterium]|nr:FAD-binding oxidoreductase [Alphaproteobacteria bacterium]MBF0249126.1 FAD-binding oxidoreductase [Alphaproteobacteria bacterium]